MQSRTERSMRRLLKWALSVLFMSLLAGSILGRSRQATEDGPSGVSFKSGAGIPPPHPIFKRNTP